MILVGITRPYAVNMNTITNNPPPAHIETVSAAETTQPANAKLIHAASATTAPGRFEIATEQLNQLIDQLGVDIEASKQIRLLTSDTVNIDIKLRSLNTLAELIREAQDSSDLRQLSPVVDRGLDAVHVLLHQGEPEIKAAAKDHLGKLAPECLADLTEDIRGPLDLIRLQGTPLVPLEHYQRQIEEWAGSTAAIATGSSHEVSQIVDALHRLWKLDHNMDDQLYDSLDSIVFQTQFQDSLIEYLENGAPFCRWVKTPGNAEAPELRDLKIAASLLDTRTMSGENGSEPVNRASFEYAYKTRPIIPLDYLESSRTIAALVTGKDPAQFHSIMFPTGYMAWTGDANPTPDMTFYCMECQQSGQRVQIAYSADSHRLTPLQDQVRKLDENDRRITPETSQQASVFRVRIVEYDRFGRGNSPTGAESFVSTDRLRELMRDNGPFYVSPPNEIGAANAEYVMRHTRRPMPLWCSQDIPESMIDR